MKRFFHHHGLSIVLLSLFASFWMAQTLVGRLEYNEDRAHRGEAPVDLRAYVRSSHFWEATGENWESEFLQMGAFVFLTVFLFQKGSSESRDPDQPDTTDELPQGEARARAPWPVRRGGFILKLYENSLGLAFVALFLGAFSIHVAGGFRLYNEEQAGLGLPLVSWRGYLASSRFWFESFQNWQSEFLAIASMVILSIFLRQRGSPESKPVATPTFENAEE